MAAKKVGAPLLSSRARVSVLGLGCAGSNVVSWIKQNGGISGKLVAANTNSAHLKGTLADRRVVLGGRLMKGAGTDGSPEKGESAARASLNDLIRETNGANILFLCAGLGGGTGTGAAQVYAESLRTEGRLVIGVVALPFPVEGHRCENAKRGLDRLLRYCDAVVAVDNSKLSKAAGDLPLRDTLGVANEVMGRFVKDLAEAMTVPGLINVDYADLTMLLKERGMASIGVGVAEGEGGVERAVKQALEEQLLDIRDVSRAKGALVHISAGRAITLKDVSDAGATLSRSLPQSAKVVWGARTDPSMNGLARATVVVTGIESAAVAPSGFRLALGPLKLFKTY